MSVGFKWSKNRISSFGSYQGSVARSSGSSHKMVETGGQSDIRPWSGKSVEKALMFDFILQV